MLLFSSLLILVSATVAIAVRDGVGHDVVERNQTCVDACSEWSIVLGHCRSLYGTYPHKENMTFANDFLACCCVGQEQGITIGREELRKATETCEGCYTTPGLIKKDLAYLLELCPRQEQQGDIDDAALFRPVGYSTVEDLSKAAIEGGGRFRSFVPSLPAVVVFAGTVVVAGALLPWLSI